MNVYYNNYRLIVHVRYERNAIYVRFIGTHQEYNNVDAANI
jgi:mRNA interferase HigB